MGETEWNSVTKVPSFKAGEDSLEKVKIDDRLIFTLCLLTWISAEFRPSWLSGLHLDQVTFKRKVCGEQCVRHLLVFGCIWFRLVEDVWTLASSSLTASAAVHTTTTRKLPQKLHRRLCNKNYIQPKLWRSLLTPFSLFSDPPPPPPPPLFPPPFPPTPTPPLFHRGWFFKGSRLFCKVSGTNSEQQGVAPLTAIKWPLVTREWSSVFFLST